MSLTDSTRASFNMSDRTTDTAGIAKSKTGRRNKTLLRCQPRRYRECTSHAQRPTDPDKRQKDVQECSNETRTCHIVSHRVKPSIQSAANTHACAHQRRLAARFGAHHWQHAKIAIKRLNKGVNGTQHVEEHSTYRVGPNTRSITSACTRQRNRVEMHMKVRMDGQRIRRKDASNGGPIFMSATPRTI